MRLTCISDMHGNAVAFEEVIEDLDRQNPDEVICLGDIAMRGPESKKCVDLLQSLNPVLTVRGNFDHMFTRLDAENVVPEDSKDEMDLRAFQYACGQLSEEEMKWLAHLPTEEKRTFEGTSFEFYHASPNSLSERIWPWASDEELASLFNDENTEILVSGHIHRSFIRYLNGKTVINTGSIGATTGPATRF